MLDSLVSSTSILIVCKMVSKSVIATITDKLNRLIIGYRNDFLCDNRFLCFLINHHFSRNYNTTFRLLSMTCYTISVNLTQLCRSTFDQRKFRTLTKQNLKHSIQILSCFSVEKYAEDRKYKKEIQILAFNMNKKWHRIASFRYSYLCAF